MKIIRVIKRFVHNSDKSVELLTAIAKQTDKAVSHIESETRLLDLKLRSINERLDALIALQNKTIAAPPQQPDHRDGPFSAMQTPPVITRPNEPVRATTEQERTATIETVKTALARHPLMIDAKTYNTSHPDYDSSLVRNFPGKIFNAASACSNAVYGDLKHLARGDEVPDGVWRAVLKGALDEAKTVPHADQVFERRAYVENYMREITQRHQAHYYPGWVNLDDALFLYWLVRKLNPKTVVQAGVCNGLSSAFMMLALAKNGADGTLHVVDLPPVFNPAEPAWTVKGKVYGVVIPEGRTSGWIVPDAYRDRFEVQNGDAKALLPAMIDRLKGVDMFYHDSDHTYDHMMFEFREAKRKLRPGGLVVADDISWNASMWDFADEHGVPSYNYKGTMGVAFF